MSQWRVTAENPLRGRDGLDYERCATLHNLLIERGWTASGRSLSDLDRRTWWEFYGGDAELSSHATKLSSQLIAFLKIAWHGYTSSTQPHAIFRYLAGLASPDELWGNVNYGENESDSNKKRFVTLYMANWALGASHPLGLVFDQDTSTAIQHISIHDTSATMNGRQIWLPLELILEGFHDMIDQGKVLAVDSSYEGEQERVDPWIMPSFTESDVRETLDAFDRLTRAIETRMPGELSGKTQHLDATEQDVPAPNSFAGRIWERIKGLRFSQIAPGLHVPKRQPFSSIVIEEGKLRPILLFGSSQNAFQETERAPWGEDVPISPFPKPFHAITNYPAGLYLTETDPDDAHPYQDGCKLILPYAIGVNGWARTSDGALFGENVHAQGPTATPAPRSTQLYQQGFNHFIKSHDVQLKYILRHWAESVEQGKWNVDAQGVAEGIEKWMEADTEEHWQDYQLPISW